MTFTQTSRYFGIETTTIEARDGKTYAGVRQTKLGVKASEMTPLGELKTQVEFDFFGSFTGTGAPPFADEQPQIRGRLVYADLTNGRTTLRIGQDWSPSFAEALASVAHALPSCG